MDVYTYLIIYILSNISRYRVTIYDTLDQQERVHYNIILFSLHLPEDLRGYSFNSNVCAYVRNNISRYRDETVTFDITLMSRKGSASVDSTVLSRSQCDDTSCRAFKQANLNLQKRIILRWNVGSIVTILRGNVNVSKHSFLLFTFRTTSYAVSFYMFLYVVITIIFRSLTWYLSN